MRNKTDSEGYEEHPFGKKAKLGRVVKDLLPPPHELARMEKKSKITITLNDSSVEFFKKQAKKYKTPYQAMIRNLLQQYAARASDNAR
jgi:predicted DNA binding CopG/RHH family protein